MVQLMCKHAIMASNRKTKPILKNKTFYWTLSKVGIKIQSFKRTITCHLNIFSRTTGIIKFLVHILPWNIQKTSMSELGFTYFLRSNIHKMSSSLIWASVSVVKLQLIVDLIRCSIPKAFTEQARKNPVNTTFPINSSPSSLKNV